jgi:hypothetical protein
MNKISEKFFKDISLGDFIKLKGLNRGIVLYLEQDVSIIIGDATPYVRPTSNDGGIGWGWEEDYGKFKLLKVEYYEIPGTYEPFPYEEMEN